MKDGVLLDEEEIVAEEAIDEEQGVVEQGGDTHV